MKTIRLEKIAGPVSNTVLGACLEDVNHELYGGIWSQMIYGEAFDEPEENGNGVSGMWQPLYGSCSLADGGYKDAHRQVLKDAGIYNRGLKRSGMYFTKDKEYRGYLIAKAAEPAVVTVSLRGTDPTEVYGESSFTVSGDWAKYEFELTSAVEEFDGCFAVCTEGEAALGYAFLEPGEWGLYKGLHVRRDVAEGLENMKLGILRFGGSMTNAPEYLWKKMLGAPEERSHYKGTWYPYSSLGFALFEFIELCEKLGVECVPAVNSFETTQDMYDFVQYLLGTDESNEWVQLRKKSHHPEPYKVKYIEVGNEERIDESYADRFITVANGVWAASRDVTMIIADTIYYGIIEDPFNFPPEYNARQTTSLAPYKRMLEFTRENGMEGKVWIDIHWTTKSEDRYPIPDPEHTWSFISHIRKLVPDCKERYCALELNAHSHEYARGMANVYAIMEAINHYDDLCLMASANCLQVDKHCETVYDQGLLFMNNHSVWYQAAGCVNILFDRVMLDQRFEVDETLADDHFCYSAMTDGKRISVVLLNRDNEPLDVCVELPFEGRYTYEETVMTYDKGAVNTAENKEFIRVPDAVCEEGEGALCVTLPANTIAAYMIG